MVFLLYQWVADESEELKTPPIKISNPNVFAPQGSNPKELRDKVKEVRRYIRGIGWVGIPMWNFEINICIITMP